MFERIHSNFCFLELFYLKSSSIPLRLYFCWPILLILLAFGCSMKQQIPIDTANLLPQELALEYLRTTWSEIQPTEEGIFLDEGKFFGPTGKTKFHRYEQLGVNCRDVGPGAYQVWVKSLSDELWLSIRKLPDRGKVIKICTALVSLGVQLH